MEEIFNKLKKFEKHVELIKANKNTLSSVQKIFNCRIPADLESWYKVFNGGYVFSTNFFSTKVEQAINMEQTTISMYQTGSILVHIKIS